MGSRLQNMQTSQLVRPMALVPNMQEVMDAATRAAVAAQGSQSMLPNFNQQPRSAFNPVAPPALYPEIALFSQLGQLFPQAAELAQLQQQQQQQQQQPQTESGSRGKARSSDKASSAYASRHQAAEQRRRTRINDRCVQGRVLDHVVPHNTACSNFTCPCRLDRLRAVVPHAERANTAAFLEVPAFSLPFTILPANSDQVECHLFQSAG